MKNQTKLLDVKSWHELKVSEDFHPAFMYIHFIDIKLYNILILLQARQSHKVTWTELCRD